MNNLIENGDKKSNLISESPDNLSNNSFKNLTKDLVVKPSNESDDYIDDSDVDNIDDIEDLDDTPITGTMVSKLSTSNYSLNTRTSITASENGFARYLQQINAIASLSPEEEFLLAKNYLEQHDLEAAHRLVTSHLKLVVKIALSYRNYNLPMVELVSEGNMGLMKAVKKYNPDLGHRLSTYAMWWIKASIQEYVLKSWSLVKLGTTAAQKKLFFSLGKLKHRIRNMHSRDVNEQDYKFIASELGVTVEEVSEMNRRLSGNDLSLNSYTKDDESNRELIEFVPETRPSPEMIIADRQDASLKKQLLAEALCILNDRELNILQQRKLTSPPTTLKILSDQYNISEERVRQIENKAFEKLQMHMLSSLSANQLGSTKTLA